MRRFVLATVILAVFIAPAISWQWPVKEISPESSFGQSISGSFSRGLVLGGVTESVKPLGAGTVVFVADPGEGVASAASGVVVVDHDGGLRSIYMNLRNPPSRGTVVTESSVLGQVGGDSGQRLVLLVVDTLTGAYVNPLILLPNLADTARPVISSILASGQTGLYDLAVNRQLPRGTYDIVIGCTDRLTPAGVQTAPYGVVVVVDGEVVLSIENQQIITGPDGMALSGDRLLAHDDVFGPTGDYIVRDVTIDSEPTAVQVIVSDSTGNSTSIGLDLGSSP